MAGSDDGDAKPGLPAASQRVADAALREGDVEQAELELKLALQANPRDASSHFLLGCLLERRGERDQAIVAFQRAASLDPAHADALFNLGTLLLARGDAVPACGLLETAVAVRDAHVPSYNNLGKAYFLTGLPELAIAAWEEALRRDPTNAVAAGNLAHLAAAAGLPAVAASYRERLAAPRPRAVAAPGGGPGAAGAWTPTWPVAGPAPAARGAPPPPPDDAPAAPADADVEALAEVLRDLPHVSAERRGGQLVLSGWTSGPLEKELLARVLAAHPGVLDLTGADNGDPQRMIEVDAVLFVLTELDEENIGFNFLKLIDLNFSFFAADNLVEGTGFTAPPDLTGAVTGLSQEGWIFSASAAYSVNIANASANRVAVLAQPHLTALSGTPADFLAGGELVFQVAGLNSGDIKPYPFGTSLTVTPTLLRTPAADGTPRVHLKVLAQRTSVLSLLEEESTSPTAFQKVNVASEAVLEMDQTLILSGLSQRESRTGRSGVPILMDIPLLKYLFSTETTIQNDSAVVILLTPRDPAFKDERNRQSLEAFVEKRREFLHARNGPPEELERFRARYPDWERLPPNRFASHVFLMENSELYRAVSAQEIRADEPSLELLGPDLGSG